MDRSTPRRNLTLAFAEGGKPAQTGPGYGSRQPTPMKPPNPNRPPSIWILLLVLLASAGLITCAAIWIRRSALRTWRRYADEAGGELELRNSLSPARIVGSIDGRDLIMQTATSSEDDAPYYHTCAAAPIRNPAGIALGLRRKSLREETQTRRETIAFDLGDAEFERRFFMMCNLPEHMQALLPPNLRKELLRYGDIEIYIRATQVEWRRSGEVADLGAIRRLNGALGELAERIDALPRRNRTLTQQLADDDLLRKGV